MSVHYLFQDGAEYPHVIRVSHQKLEDFSAPKGWKYFVGRGHMIDTENLFWLEDNVGNGNYCFDFNRDWSRPDPVQHFDVSFKNKQQALLYKLACT